jgi:hypothetical protein
MLFEIDTRPDVPRSMDPTGSSLDGVSCKQLQDGYFLDIGRPEPTEKWVSGH